MTKNHQLLAWCTSGAVHVAAIGALAWASATTETVEVSLQQGDATINLTLAAENDHRERPHGDIQPVEISNDHGRPRGAACEYPRQCLKRRAGRLEHDRSTVVIESVSIARQPTEEPVPVTLDTPLEVEHAAPALTTPEIRQRDPFETTFDAIPTPDPSIPRAKSLRRSAEAVAQVVVAVPEQATSSTAGADVDQLPRKLHTNPAPPYPPDAFARRQQGVVFLDVHLNPRGLVDDIAVLKSSGVASLDRAALETVRGWRFEPARRSGSPVSMSVTVPVRFEITGRP